MKKFEPGDTAPDFKGINQDGDTISKADFKGSKFILFVYPKDNTPGCTAEACNLAENYDKLKSEGFEIIGLSADSTKSHTKFIDKHNFPFDLIADEDKSILNDYGCWGEKKFMGRVYDGIHRKTFVIDEDGKFIHIFEKVKTKDHTNQILETLKS